MITTKIYKLTFYCVLVIGTFTNCDFQKTSEHLYYEGIVLDETGQPLSGCVVRLQAQKPFYMSKEYYEVEETFTDKSGRFLIFANAARSNKYSVFIGHPSSNKSIVIRGVSSGQLKLDFCRTLILR